MTAFSDADRGHMARALALAERGLYTTTPNPRVGCVLVADGAVIGEGWHERTGGPHAEANAINDRPVVVDFIVHEDAMVWPMVAAGTSNDEVMAARGVRPDFGDHQDD